MRSSMFRVPLRHDCLKLLSRFSLALSNVSPFVKASDPRSIIHSRKLVCGWLAAFPYLSGSQYVRGGCKFFKISFLLICPRNFSCLLLILTQMFFLLSFSLKQPRCLLTHSMELSSSFCKTTF